MSLTKLIIATVVLLGLGGLVYWSKKHPEDKSSTATASLKLLDVPEAQLQSLELTKKDAASLTLSKDKNKWTITAPAAYPADQEAATSAALALTGLTADSEIEDAAKDPSKYGLSNPSLTVVAHEKSGKTDKLIFGDNVPAESDVYLQIGSSPKVYAVSAAIKNSLAKDLNDLRDKRLLTFDSSQVSRLELVSPKSAVEFGKANQTDWQILKPQTARADSFQVDDLLRKLSDAKMDLSGKVADIQATDRAFASAHPLATAKVTDQNGVQSLEIRRDKDTYYARSNVVAGTFKVSNDLGEAIAKPWDSFRNKKLFDFGFTDTNRIEIHRPGADKTFIRSGTDWKSNNQTVDPGAVQSLVDKLRDLAATGFVPTGFGTPDISITVVSNESKRTEKVEFSKTADGYIARREGQPALYKLDAKTLNDILEAVTAIKATVSGAKK